MSTNLQSTFIKMPYCQVLGDEFAGRTCRLLPLHMPFNEKGELVHRTIAEQRANFKAQWTQMLDFSHVLQSPEFRRPSAGWRGRLEQGDEERLTCLVIQCVFQDVTSLEICQVDEGLIDTVTFLSTEPVLQGAC